MKKLMFFAAICLGSVLVGCDSYEESPDKDIAWTFHGGDVVTKVVEIEGHKYIIMDGYYSGGIIHAESCGCKK